MSEQNKLNSIKQNKLRLMLSLLFKDGNQAALVHLDFYGMTFVIRVMKLVSSLDYKLSKSISILNV